MKIYNFHLFMRELIAFWRETEMSEKLDFESGNNKRFYCFQGYIWSNKESVCQEPGFTKCFS